MRWFLFSIILLLVLPGIAKSKSPAWGYKKFPALHRQKKDYLPRKIRLGRQLLRANRPKGAPTHSLIGVEQIYTNRSGKKKVFIKKGVKVFGKNVIGGWRKLRGAYVLHLKRRSSATAFFAVGLNRRERMAFEMRMRKAYRRFSFVEALLIPKAVADAVGVETPRSASDTPSTLQRDLTSVIATGIPLMAATCALQYASGSAYEAYNNTMDRLKNASVDLSWESFGGSMRGVGRWLKETGQSVASGAKATWQYGKEVYANPQKVVDDIQAGYENVKKAAASMYEGMRQTIAGWDDLPDKVKSEIICMAMVAGGPAIASLALAWTGVGAAMSARLLAFFAQMGARVAKVMPAIMSVLNADGITESEAYKQIRAWLQGESEPSQALLASAGGEPGRAPASFDAVYPTEQSQGRGGASAPASAGKYQGFRGRYRTEREREAVMAANRALSDSDRIKAIEAHVGRSLSQRERERLLSIHNVQCAETKCTAQEIRDLKDLAGVTAMFADLPKEQVLDLYRMNLLGNDRDLSEFEAILRAERKPALGPALPLRERARLQVAKTQERIAKLDQQIEALEAKPNHSATKLAELRRQRQAQAEWLERQQEELELMNPNSFAALDRALEERRIADARARMNRPVTDAERAEIAELLRRPVSSSVIGGSDRQRESGSGTPITGSEMNRFTLFSELRHSIEEGTATASQRVLHHFFHTTKAKPKPAIYRSPSTGDKMTVEVVGFPGDSDKGDRTKMTIRFKTSDGRTVTKDVPLAHLMPEEGRASLASVVGGQAAADSWIAGMAEEATGREAQDRLREIERLQREDPDYRLGTQGWMDIDTEAAEIRRNSAPLTVREIAHIEAIAASYDGAGLRTRLPMEVLANGRIQRPTFTREELSELEGVQFSISRRTMNPGANEDRDYFDQAQRFKPADLIAARVKERKREIYNSMSRFVGGSSRMDMPRTPEYRRFNPSRLEKAFDGRITSNIKRALKDVHEVLSRHQGPTISNPQDLKKLQDGLRALSGDKSAIAGSEDLQQFIEFGKYRSAYTELSLMRD